MRRAKIRKQVEGNLEKNGRYKRRREKKEKRGREEKRGKKEEGKRGENFFKKRRERSVVDLRFGER